VISYNPVTGKQSQILIFINITSKWEEGIG